METFTRPLLGQEAICPDGLGRVVAFEDNFPIRFVQIDTYIKNRSCKWSPENIRLVSLTTVPCVSPNEPQSDPPPASDKLPRCS